MTEGLRLADQARRRADRIKDTIAGVAWVGGGNYQELANPREAREWYASELAKPHTAQATIPRARLLNRLVASSAQMGELAKARAYLAEANTENKPTVLLFFEGGWELAGEKLTARMELLHATGNLQEELWLAFDLARLRKFTRKRAQAVQFLQRALDVSVEAVLGELTMRSELATMAADAGELAEALTHLQRCRQIVGAGENWFGLTGNVECAEAVVAAAQGEYSLAEAHFEKAIATFQRYCLPWEEADTLQYWGRALLAAGEGERAIEKFDAAIEIYRSRGASGRFIEYVMADKKHAQDSE